jgi:hypothetical protein
MRGTNAKKRTKMRFTSFVVALLAIFTLAAPAFATPGAVNKQGCHGHPRHCHKASDLSTMRNGRHYVPFGKG